MEASEYLTVNEALDTPFFRPAKLIAGHSGLNKKVTWAHILELTECRGYVNGGELVLTTGAGWKNEQDSLIFTRNLIAKKVAALCIQLGSKFNSFRSVSDIPQEILDEANLAEMPLIVFPEDHDCRYIDLVRNLHSMILNKSYKTLMEQDKFMQELYRLLVRPHSIKDILFFIHEYINADVAFIPLHGKATFAPPNDRERLKEFIVHLKTASPDSTETLRQGNLDMAYRKVHACNRELGCLALFSSERSLGSFDYLVLEKCSNTIAQEYLGRLFAEEKERQKREQWVTRWLSGRLDSRQVEKYLLESEFLEKPSGCVACLIDKKTPLILEPADNDSLLTITGMARSIFSRLGFNLFWQKENHSAIYLLINVQDPQTWKVRLKEALTEISNLKLSGSNNNSESSISFYVGKLVDDTARVKHSVETAREAQMVGKTLGSVQQCFYDDLHVYRIVQMLDRQSELENFITDYLHPIADENGNLNKKFLNTLIALRDCQYNKKDAAEKLFLARQSLYQRISNLEELFGADFLASPEKRVCLEIALYGTDYLSNKNAPAGY